MFCSTSRCLNEPRLFFIGCEVWRQVVQSSAVQGSAVQSGTKYNVLGSSVVELVANTWT